MYNICILQSPVPQQDDEAWKYLFAILGKRDDEAGCPAAPIFLTLIDRLTARYPCICDLPEEEMDGERAMWSDGPLKNNAEHSVTVLGLRSERVGEGLPFIVDVANAMGLVVFDDQQGAIFRPKPAPALPAAAPVAKTFAGGKLVSEKSFLFHVRITGIDSGRTLAEVAQQLAPLFKRTEAEVVALLRQDAPIVKRDVSQEVAAKYKTVLEQRGCLCAIDLAAINSCVRDATPEERYREQAEGGDRDAQLALAAAYLAGNGIANDAEKAVYWWTKAAEQGSAEAQLKLGIAYAGGIGTAPDAQQAFRWLRTAAEQGMAEAQNELGAFLERSSSHDEEARQWYGLAAAQGFAPAQINLANTYVENQEYGEACRWFRKAAEQGDASAQNSLGILYKNGQGVDRDIDDALAWLTRAADQGHGPAAFNIGNIYFSSQGLKRNGAEAVKWFLVAVERKQAQAAYALGLCHDEGNGVKQDKAKALTWFHRAAFMGDAGAQYRLALMYLQGDGIPQDGKEALTWMRQAAEQGHREAQHLLGMRYLWGLDVPKNTELGRSWLQKAAAQGHEEAAKELRKPPQVDEMERMEIDSSTVFRKDEKLTSFNGFGRTYYGQRDFEPDGSFITTKWLIMLFFPIVPSASVRVRTTSSDGPFAKTYELIENRPLCWPQIFSIYAYTYGLLPLAFVLTEKMRDTAQWVALAVAAAVPTVLRFFARRRAGVIG